MSMSDWFDNEKWQRMPRTWSGKMNPQGATESARQLDMRTNRAGEPMYTKWFNQRGWDQIPRQGDTREALHAGAAKDRPSYEEQFTEIMRNRHGPSSPAVTQPANLQYPGIGPNAGISLMPNWQGSSLTEDRDVGMGANRFLQLGDPRNIRSGPDLPPASGFRSPATGMLRREPAQRVVPPTPPGVTDEFKFGRWFPVNNQADEKTVIQNFADPLKPNKITTTFETKEQPQSQPTSLMNILNPSAWQDVAKRKWLERQAARRTY